jgi:hypothetical protein
MRVKRATGTLSPRNRNDSKRDRDTHPEPGVQLKSRRPFVGIRDRYGRATKPDKELEPPKRNKQRRFPIAPAGYPFGVKPWLRRNETWWEYNISPRSIRRLERRGFLHPHVLLGVYLYERAEIERAIRANGLLDWNGDSALTSRQESAAVEGGAK